MTDISQIGKSIKRYREQQGITQRVLADRIMVSFQAISAWERGTSVPDLENVVRIAECFGVSVDALLTQQDKPLYVGIDGGGTKTEFVLFEADGTVQDVIFREGSNPNDRGLEHSISVLTDGLEQLLRGRTATAIFCGIGGVSLPEYRKAIIGSLSDRFHTHVGADTDAANVLSMGADPENSMALICGTGSCVFVRKGRERYRIGGWGYLIDPAGSAFDVGRDALRCALAVQDGMAKPGLLSQRIEEILGGPAYDHISTVYGGGRPYIAGLARTVTELAAAGDETSLQILRENAARLALLIRTAHNTYGQTAQIVGGGSFLGCDLYRNMVQEQAGVTIELPTLPPAYGACVETLRLEGLTPDETFQQNFANTYRR